MKHSKKDYVELNITILYFEDDVVLGSGNVGDDDDDDSVTLPADPF